jgi:5-methylcytosine-specific restriction endonuclease McrA
MTDIRTRGRKWSVENRASIRKELASVHGWFCGYCGIKLIPDGEENQHCELVSGKWVIEDGYSFPELDHKIPVVRGGADVMENLVLACISCNRHKRTMTDAEFMEWRSQ